MATEIRVPTLGESISEATVGKWFKQRGDPVKADEPLVELETEKVTLEVNAPSAGVLSEIVADSGETVAIGALLGSLSAGAAGKAADKGEAPKPEAVKAEAPAPKPGPAMPPAPSAAKIAAENGVDLSAVSGSGKRGQVLKGDVIDVAREAGAGRPAGARAPPRRLPRRFARRARPTTPRARNACG